MHHSVLTIDVATVRPFDFDDLRMRIDLLLAEYPVEFEDWKTTYHEEDREL